MSQSSNCGNCTFFMTAPGGMSGEGICRRNPPTMFMLSQDNPLAPGKKSLAPGGGFPPTRKDQWCGEHKPKNQPSFRQPPDKPTQEFPA